MGFHDEPQPQIGLPLLQDGDPTHDSTRLREGH